MHRFGIHKCLGFCEKNWAPRLEGQIMHAVWAGFPQRKQRGGLAAGQLRLPRRPRADDRHRMEPRLSRTCQYRSIIPSCCADISPLLHNPVIDIWRALLQNGLSPVWWVLGKTSLFSSGMNTYTRNSQSQSYAWCVRGQVEDRLWGQHEIFQHKFRCGGCVGQNELSPMGRGHRVSFFVTTSATVIARQLLIFEKKVYWASCKTDYLLDRVTPFWRWCQCYYSWCSWLWTYHVLPRLPHFLVHCSRGSTFWWPQILHLSESDENRWMRALTQFQPKVDWARFGKAYFICLQ